VNITNRWFKGIFVSDHQAPFHMVQAQKLYEAFAKRYKPDLVCLGGDIVDLISISRFGKPGRKFDYLADEIAVAQRDIIEPTRAATPKAEMIWLEGNHEARLNRLLMDKNMRALLGFPSLNLPSAFNMRKQGIKWVPGKGSTENGMYEVNQNLILMHGKKAGITAARQTAERWGHGCVIQGHVHKATMFRRTTGFGENIMGVTAPCMCADPDWGDGMNDYSRGFVTFQYTKGKEAQYQVQFQDISRDGTELYANQLGDVPTTFYAKHVGKDKWTVKEG